jgi:hypothetical protein
MVISLSCSFFCNGTALDSGRHTTGEQKHLHHGAGRERLHDSPRGGVHFGGRFRAPINPFIRFVPSRPRLFARPKKSRRGRTP